MDSSPPYRERLRNFFSSTRHAGGASSEQDCQQQAPDGSSAPDLRSRERTDLLAYWRDWQNDAVLGAIGNAELPEDSPGDASFLGGEFSLSELLSALPSDRLELGTCDMRDLPPLSAACLISDLELAGSPAARVCKIRELLAGGADPRECDPAYGRSALHWACIHAELDVIRGITEALTKSSCPRSVSQQQTTVNRASDINQPDVNGLTPLEAVLALRAASKREHAEIVEYLISQGADVSCLPRRGAELLFAEFLTVDIARMVLATGIAVDVRDDAHCTPLFKVALAGHLPLVRFLLQQGADPRQRVFFGGSLLNHYGMSVEVAALLLEHGADADLKDDLGMTPIMFACQDKNLPLIRLLLRHGASLRARSVDGMRVVDYAPDQETVRFLETEAGFAPDTRLADD